MHQIRKFFKEQVWLLSAEPGKPVRNFIIRWIRILVGAASSFQSNQCYLKASALTFYTLLSTVPVLAIVFGIAKGFGFEELLKQQVLRQFAQQPELAQQVIDFAYNFLQHTEGSVIAGIGLIVLLWAALKLISGVESALNAIWCVPNSRNFLRQCTDYLALLILCPIFVIGSTSLTLFVAAHVQEFARVNALTALIDPMLLYTMKIVPFFMAWLLFTAIYLFMPNTKVLLRASVVGGILAGTAYQCLQWFYIHFQIGLSSYGAIYGSFAALPLFLIWIHLSWLILLAGAEIAFHLQNESTYSNAYRMRRLASPESIGVLVSMVCIRKIKQAMGPTIVGDLAAELGLSPIRLKEILDPLVAKGIFAYALDAKEQQQLVPARAFTSIRVADVIDALNASRSQRVPLLIHEDLIKAEGLIAEWRHQAETNPTNISLAKASSC